VSCTIRHDQAFFLTQCSTRLLCGPYSGDCAAYELSWPATFLFAKRQGPKLTMKALPSSTDSDIFPTGFVAPKAPLELQPRQIFDLLAERRETSDEELELIEMRYQQMLAIENLEDLFAEGQLDRM
jgi:hypothetical protein